MRGVRKETVIQLQSGIVAMEGYMKFKCVIFVLKIYARFCLLQLKGTQEREFFWLRFWILYYFIVSYAQIFKFHSCVPLINR